MTYVLATLIQFLISAGDAPELFSIPTKEVEVPDEGIGSFLSNPWFYVAIGVFVAIAVVRKILARKSSPPELKGKKKRSKPRLARVESGLSESSSESEKKIQYQAPRVQAEEGVVTEKTSREITNIFHGVKSIGATEKKVSAPTADNQKVERQNLETSGVIEALSLDLVSPVQTDETKNGRYSKMTVDASLILDEE